VSEDAGFKPRTVSDFGTGSQTLLTTYSARSLPKSARSYPHSARSRSHSARTHPSSAAQSRQSARLSLQSSELAHPALSSECCPPPPPFGSKGGRHTRLRERGRGEPIRTKGHTLWYSRYIILLRSASRQELLSCELLTILAAGILYLYSNNHHFSNNSWRTVSLFWKTPAASLTSPHINYRRKNAVIFDLRREKFSHLCTMHNA
jgi:hypothetical protein